MILLDENTDADQRMMLEARRIPVRQVGVSWGRKGMDDPEIVTALQQLRSVTFLTRDPDFFRRELCHPSYCLALIDASASKTAEYALRFLRHRNFRTHAQRMGKVARLQPTGIVFWAWREPAESIQPWT